MAEELTPGTNDIEQVFSEFVGTEEPQEVQPTETTEEVAPVEATEQPDAAAQEEHLIDPATLPPELKPHWKRMTRAYNERLGELRTREQQASSFREKAELVDRFYNDPQYAAQTLLAMAPRLGLTVTQANGQPLPFTLPGAQQQTQGSDVPEHIMQAAKQAVAGDKDMEFIAPVIAKAAWAITQAETAGLKQAEQQRTEQARTSEFQAAVDELEEEGVTWREAERDMEGFFQFLKSAASGQGPLRHPKYGNFLKILYQGATGNKDAQVQAGKRLQQAFQSKTVTSTPTRNNQPDVQRQIKEAKSSEEKWQLAMRDAVRQAREAMRG